MTHHETQARRILDQAAKDNAESPIGIDKHRVRLIAKALAEGDAQRDRLASAAKHLRNVCLRTNRTPEIDEAIGNLRRVFADIDKEQA